MELILTHEQADFDAIASTLAVSLLKESLIPVLPYRMNRNVRKFFNLYGSELPFVDVRDLPPDLVESVTLVDTQSLVTLKGVTRRTKVSVIDHHQLRSDLPADWQVSIEKTGATTTLLVDSLRDQNGSFNVIQATLMLLGIYEDTGSLTYASTTSRDVRAAAYLLDQGASLKLAAEFLNPSLSEDQLKLSDRLLASAKNLNIHGKNILVSSANAMDMNEEISSVAHKLRDLLDPDALFIFVRTSEGIRLVARSTSDQIDVSKAAALFSGGGHERASAALVHPEDFSSDPDLALQMVQEKLCNALPDLVKPSITVGKIMSRKPQLLSVDTPLEEAARLMQRYGYEGFPVVKDEKIVGLLTRRAVDRALGHKLKLKTGSLMEAGSYSLVPSDTLDALQNLMAVTGWGQIPVLDPETQKVTGIVTRTDLLKMLPKGTGPLPGQMNLSTRLEKALPPLRLALLKLVADQSHENHQALYIVGGFVRDLLLDRPSIDFDIVVEGDAIRLGRKLAEKFGGRIVSHSRFGTAKWQIIEIRPHLTRLLAGISENGEELPESLDLISARTEFYDHPSALPTVERSSIKLDLHRRDFTINTLALRLDGRHYGELYDYWGGLADLQKKQVKVLHSLSFVDDPTRMLRAVRFEQRFHFMIENRTRQLMDEARPLLKQVSGERLRHEFDLFFSEKDTPRMFTRLQELNLLSAIHPDLTFPLECEKPFQTVLNDPLPLEWHLPALEGSQPIRRVLAYLVWLVPQPAAVTAEFSERLRLPNSMQKTLQEAGKLYCEFDSLKGLKSSQVFMRLEVLPVWGIYALFLLCQDSQVKKLLEAHGTKWSTLVPNISGEDLKQLKVPPGPLYHEIIQALRFAWINGDIVNDQQEKAYLDTLLAQNQIETYGRH